MAARRLIAVMLVLLFLSSLAAALAPVERQAGETSTTTTPEPQSETPDGGGRIVRATLDAGAKRPGTVRARVGDQLQLRVTGPRVATIELAGLGPTADVDPLAPARFDVLLVAPGEYTVRTLQSGRPVGRIVVSPRAPRAADSGPARPRS